MSVYGLFIHGFELSRRRGVVSNFDDSSRGYVVKIRPLDTFLEGGLPKIWGGDTPLNPCMGLW
jgi:hypothetical protein